jgi:hypothetical protein
MCLVKIKLLEIQTMDEPFLELRALILPYIKPEVTVRGGQYVPYFIEIKQF